MTKLTLLIVILHLSLLPAFGGEGQGDLSMTEVRKIYEDKQLSDVAIVSKLAEALNRRVIALKRAGATLKLKLGNEVSTIARLIAERPYPKQPKMRPAVIKKVMTTVGGLSNRKEVEAYLRLSLALAGESLMDDALLKFIGETDSGFPEPVQATALEAMRKTTVPIRAIPRLLVLARSPWHYIAANGVGPQKPRRIYPLRDGAFECLKVLGITCRRNVVMDKTVDPVWGQKLSKIRIVVDRNSLMSDLRVWIQSKELRIRKSAVEVIGKLSGSDIDKLVDLLLKDDQVGAEIKDTLRNQRKAKR